MNSLKVRLKNAGLIILANCLVHVPGIAQLCHAQQASQARSIKGHAPNIEDYATIETYSNGAPVYSFSNLCYIYGISPDLLPGAQFQQGNTNPKNKITPKKSWEIKHNLVGATNEITVKSPWADSETFLPIHLIDGDPNSIWCSWGSPVADERPEWIRIDLPMETTVTAVALVLSPSFSATRYNTSTNINYGRSLPKELEVRLSRDAWHWDTVYANKSFSGDSSGTTKIQFPPRLAKQVWIVANNFPNEVGFAGHIFSIGELEVLDPEGNNLALVSRGAGITASSKTSSHDNDWFTQKSLWGPLMYDLGDKWVRVGDHNGSFTWNYVEREKGKLEVDPWADELISECKRNGVNVIMGLDLTMGNHRYQNPPRKLDWRQVRILEINNNYEDQPGLAFQNPEMWAGFLRYVDYMGRHFRGRVAYYEIGNEWDVCFPPEQYMKLFNEVYAVLKKADPDARVMLGQTAGGCLFTDLFTCLGQPWETGVRGGRLPVSHDTLLLADNSKIGNATLSVDAKNLGDSHEGLCGFVLRYKDSNDFLAALYSRMRKSIYFADPRGDKLGNKFSESIASKDVGELGPDVHLQVKIEGTSVTLTVSDGKLSFSTQNTFKAGNFTGPYGLFSNFTRPIQNGSAVSFDNFDIMDAAGRSIVHETFSGPDASAPAALRYVYGRENPVKPGWGAKIDALGWHSEGQDPQYVAQIKDLKKKCAALGFKGLYSCGEVGPSRGWLYPPGDHQTEMQYAKIQIKKLFCNNGMDVEAGVCHPEFTGFHHDQPFTRLTWPTSTEMALCGGASYYAWRNYATALDGFHACEFPVTFGNPDKFMCFTFESGDKRQLLIGAWYTDKMVDGIAELQNDITVPGVLAEKAWGIDIFNGTEQELNLTPSGNGTLLKGILIKDYPTLIRLNRK